MRPLIFLLLLCPSAHASPLSEAAQSREWKYLLHYHKSLFGVEKSEADGTDFFFSKDGSTDPEAELLAELEAMRPESALQVGPRKLHPQCTFPLRWDFIKRSLHPDIKDVPCPEFIKWKEDFHAESVTLIYAAPYLGSPASMFGHTFMRIDSAPRTGSRVKSDYLDFGISFEANAGNGFDILYALRGVLGSYPGVYLKYPYHLKINNYNNLEARDLWEYKLTLTKPEIDRLLSHLWELGTTYFFYYFFDENCSYHLLSLLEVARPTLDLRSRFPIMTIPADTVRITHSIDDLVASKLYRPSIIKTLEARLESANAQERADFYKYKDHPESTPETVSTKTLDALLDWQRNQAMKSGADVADMDKQLSLHLLVLRSKHREPPEEVSVQNPTPPETGHPSSKLGVEVGHEGLNSFENIDLRPVLHDYLDSDDGYLEGTQLTLFKSKIGFYSDPETKFRIEDITAAEVGTLATWNKIRRNFAWTVGGGLIRPHDIQCRDCVVTQLRAGYGFALNLIRSSQIQTSAYLMPIAHTDFGGGLERAYRLSPGGELGLLFSLQEMVKFKMSFQYLRNYRFEELYPDESIVFQSQLSTHYKDWELRMMFEKIRTPKLEPSSIALSLGRYF